MRRTYPAYFKVILFASLLLFLNGFAQHGIAQQPNFGLVIHGGAGTILKENMSAEKEKEYREMLESVLRKGHEMLENGSSAIDVVEACIHIMEDSPLFNSGRGAVFTHEGKNELDASIMDGKTMNAGAVAGISTIRHPISAARAVMDKSVHVMMSGEGAEQFAALQGLEIVDPSWFRVEKRWEQLQRAKERQLEKVRENKDGGYFQEPASEEDDYKYGTVGVAVLDKAGNLAAGTSTGGMTNKRWGRIGDSPVIGAGTYANNKTCAISCTGHGEYFIRYAVAHDISALMEYKGLSVQEAADEVIQNKLVAVGGSGGVICMDTKGNVAMSFNTAGMYRGSMMKGGMPVIQIYKND